jgi:hypothetical protein
MSPKPTSPLLGYNNNVRHKGKVFHVQTEDSGVKYGHIITQLFVDGGRILKSVKTSYAEYVESERRGEIVREMMKQQHKAMFIALRDGRFDAILEASGPSQAPSATFTATQPESQTVPTLRPPVDAAIKEAAVAGADAAVRYVPSELPLPPNLGSRAIPSATPTLKTLAPALPSVPPPHPASLRVSAAPGAGRESAAPISGSRYAITRPAAIFGQSRPSRGKSVFSDDLVSDKSLDEVILSYLAAELEGEKK